MPRDGADHDHRLRRSRVLVELGWIAEAEVEVSRLLGELPDDLTVLSLFAKIKHIQGDLSQAIGYWAQIYARSPHNENVMLQLQSFLRLAENPERTNKLPSLGHPLARKPMVQAQLEQAFALFHERRLEDARACCGVIAATYRVHDPAVYKLAVIASAWIAELSGDLAAACAELGQLGHERGFEHDLDRLFALVRIYEQLGTPDTLEAAAAICRHVLHELERQGIEKISLYSQLATLERRAGRFELAAELDRKFLTGVRRRMHRPSLDDLIRVAARDHLPLDRLRAIRPADDDRRADLTRRERALAHALVGELGDARRLLVEGGEPLDRLYLGDLAVIEGDEAGAIGHYVDTLDACPEDSTVVGWLLDVHARTPSPVIAAYWADPDRRRRTLERLEAGRHVTPLRPEIWRWIATLHALGGELEEVASLSARADVLAKAAATRAMPIGRVLAASVYHFIGKAKGLVHEVWVHREPTSARRGGTLSTDDIHGNVTSEMRATIRNTFIAVREYARARFPHATADLNDYTYSYKLPKEDEPSGGGSAGLPSALAFLSVFLQRPVPHEIVSSGMLVTESHDMITIGRIGEADYKVRAAYHGNLRTLILPLANREGLERSTLVPLEIHREIVRYAADLDHAVKLVFGADVFVRS